MNKAVFLDRDGVINEDRVDYVYKADQLIVLEGVAESLKIFKEAGYKTIIITNQSGIAKKIYEHDDVYTIHELIQEQVGHLIDDFYYAPWHPSVSESLTRKPGRLMFERAIAKYKISLQQSWMVGDRERDLTPAKKMGMKTILLGDELTESADYVAKDLLEAARRFFKSK